jgi:hypothetical protein
MPCPAAAGISSAEAWPKTFQRNKKKKSKFNSEEN